MLNPDGGCFHYSKKSLDIVFLRMMIPHFSDVLTERKNLTKEYSSDNILKTNLIQDNFFWGKYKKNKTYHKRKLISRYERKLKIVYYSHTNACKIHEYFFWVKILNMEKQTLLSLFSCHTQTLVF